MRDVIFLLENIDEALKDAPTENGQIQMPQPEWLVLTRLATDARAHAARLRELADSIEQRVRAAEVD